MAEKNGDVLESYVIRSGIIKNDNLYKWLPDPRAIFLPVVMVDNLAALLIDIVLKGREQRTLQAPDLDILGRAVRDRT
jgi:hypothetical protein